MKEYNDNMKKDRHDILKINQKGYGRQIRFVAMCLLLMILTGYSFPRNWTMVDCVTSLFLPLLTYEMEYGVPYEDYASVYQIPERFFINGKKEEEKREVSVKEEDKQREKQAVTGEVKNEGVTYDKEDLSNPDYLQKHVFAVESNTSMLPEELSLDTLLGQSVCLDGYVPEKKHGDLSDVPPKILIYHTHGSEAFADSETGNVEDTIIGIGSYLSEILEKDYGISVYHDTSLYDVIDGKLDRNKAYENAYNGVSKILSENPSIEVMIDLHRDGVDEDNHLVTNVNGKPTAKIMFLNGVSRSNLNGEIAYLQNPNKKMNLAFSFQMFLSGRQQYGDYIRKIYVSSLRFNLHLLPRATLIEAGAQNNTLEEERNAMEPLAKILNDVLVKS